MLRSRSEELDLALSQKKRDVRFDIKLIEQSKQFDLDQQKLDEAIDDDDVDQIEKQITEYAGDRRPSAA